MQLKAPLYSYYFLGLKGSISYCWKFQDVQKRIRETSSIIQPEVMSIWFWHYSDAPETERREEQIKVRVSAPWFIDEDCIQEGQPVLSSHSQVHQSSQTAHPQCSAQHHAASHVQLFYLLSISGKTLNLPILKLSQWTTALQKANTYLELQSKPELTGIT